MLAMNRASFIAKLAARDFAYILAMLPLCILEFVVLTVGVSLTVSTLVLIVGFLVWLATVYAFRLVVDLDRRLVGWYRGASVAGVYRAPAEPGRMARLRTVTLDPQTGRDAGWLAFNSIVGFVIATVAITATALAIGYILMPLWWWAIPHPHTQYVTLNLGIYTVTSVGWALVTTGIGLMLLPVALMLNRAAATGHAELAVRFLGPRGGVPFASAMRY